MKNILLVGFYGEGNLGDEAILQAICENLPDLVTPIITSGSKQPYGKSIIRRGLISWPSFLLASRKCPITVFSGGILQDWSWEGVTFFAHRIIASAKMGSMPVLFGAGIGPLRSEKARRLAKRALSFVKVAYVRDQYSYNLYKSLLPNANVHLGTDWTWQYKITSRSLPSNSKMMVNLRQWGNKNLLNKVLEITSDFNGIKTGVSARKGDTNLIKEICGISEVVCPNGFVEFANCCQNAEYGIAMRYHVALAMLRAGIKTKLICYDEKVKCLAESLKLEVDENGISKQFKAPPWDFFVNNEELFKKMRNSFILLVAKNVAESFLIFYFLFVA